MMETSDAEMTESSNNSKPDLSHILHKRSFRCDSPSSSSSSTNVFSLSSLKRSSSAPMINELGESSGVSSGERRRVRMHEGGFKSTTSSPLVKENCKKYENMEHEPLSLANSFLAALNNPRPRRFSASFSPAGSPAPNRVSQLRRSENSSDWETNSEKEYHGTRTIAQSWEDLSLDSMSMEKEIRCNNSISTNVSDPLFVSLCPTSASSSPSASPRLSQTNRFSPGLSSPTRKNFTSRRSLSPISVRPSLLTLPLSTHLQIGLKRKCDWEMECSSSSEPCSKRILSLASFSNNGQHSSNSSCSGSEEMSSCSSSSSSSSSSTTDPLHLFSNTSKNNHNNVYNVHTPIKRRLVLSSVESGSTTEPQNNNSTTSPSSSNLLS